jgi:serpin B
MRASLILVLLGALCLAGCNNTKDKQLVNESINIEDVDMNRVVVSDNFTNSINVADMIVESADGDNIMFSPTSLNLALGMVDAVANSYSKDLLSKYLGSTNYGDYAEEYLKIITRYNSDDETNGYKTKLEIANALWVDDERQLKDEFKESVLKQYGAVAETVDFDNPMEACFTINDWVNKKTYGMIPEIIDTNTINGDIENVITNSIYFESPWSKPWNLNSEQETFLNNNGDKEKTNYMYREGDAYFENDKAIAFSSEYKSGLEFIGILPKNEEEFAISDLDIESLLNSRSYEYDKLNCKMPKLNFDTTADLTTILSQIGLQQLFTDEATILEIMDEPLKISKIIQKTKIELDENGTKAAAVTAISMMSNSIEQESNPIIKEVYLDRPFAFLIYDRDNNEILFIGKVNTSVGE